MEDLGPALTRSSTGDRSRIASAVCVVQRIYPSNRKRKSMPFGKENSGRRIARAPLCADHPEHRGTGPEDRIGKARRRRAKLPLDVRRLRVRLQPDRSRSGQGSAEGHGLLRRGTVQISQMAAHIDRKTANLSPRSTPFSKGGFRLYEKLPNQVTTYKKRQTRRLSDAGLRRQWQGPLRKMGHHLRRRRNSWTA